jgi:hypothetical protein
MGILGRENERMGGFKSVRSQGKYSTLCSADIGELNEAQRD